MHDTKCGVWKENTNGVDGHHYHGPLCVDTIVVLQLGSFNKQEHHNLYWIREKIISLDELKTISKSVQI